MPGQDPNQSTVRLPTPAGIGAFPWEPAWSKMPRGMHLKKIRKVYKEIWWQIHILIIN